MKVILNEDVANLGEEGDVKVVKNGYARNFLIPRGFAVPYTKGNVKVFEARKEIIESKKEEKRKAAMGDKEKIESLDITIPMPAGQNGRLFGSVTNALISDILAKNGLQIERKKIELSEHTIKATGNYSAKIKLYENEAAQLNFSIVSDKESKETESPEKKEDAAPEAEAVAKEEPLSEETAEEVTEEEKIIASEPAASIDESVEAVADAVTETDEEDPEE